MGTPLFMRDVELSAHARRTAGGRRELRVRRRDPAATNKEAYQRREWPPWGGGDEGTAPLCADGTRARARAQEHLCAHPIVAEAKHGDGPRTARLAAFLWQHGRASSRRSPIRRTRDDVVAARKALRG